MSFTGATYVRASTLLAIGLARLRNNICLSFILQLIVKLDQKRNVFSHLWLLIGGDETRCDVMLVTRDG
jgi:hypothetical protein